VWWFLSILFLIFESEERASNKSKAKYGHPRSAERKRAQAQNGINGGQPVGGHPFMPALSLNSLEPERDWLRMGHDVQLEE
jgi:hypothetical protein